MAKVLIEESVLTDIANAIRSKINSTEQFYPQELAEKINTIEQEITKEEKIYKVTSVGSSYTISAEKYANIDPNDYNVGDLFIVTPV